MVSVIHPLLINLVSTCSAAVTEDILALAIGQAAFYPGPGRLLLAMAGPPFTQGRAAFYPARPGRAGPGRLLPITIYFI